MSKRRRWLLGLALALVAGGVVVWRILAPGGRMEVQLIFLGYTNVPVIAQPAYLPPVSEVIGPQAVLCATNTGSVPVKLSSSFRAPNLSNTTQFAYPTGRGLPAVLKPGESMTVEVWYPMNGLRWRTEFMYQRHNLADRLYEKAWNSGNVTVQTWMLDLLPSPKTGWAESDWITSPPPAVPVFNWSNQRWTKTSTRLEGPIRWEYHGTFRDDRPVSKFSDFIDLSRPRSRYHITAPLDLGDVDLSDLTKQ